MMTSNWKRITILAVTVNLLFTTVFSNSLFVYADEKSDSISTISVNSVHDYENDVDSYDDKNDLSIESTISEEVFDNEELSVARATETLASTIVSDARSYVGKLKYVYGGNSLTSGADCGGFVCAIFEKYGYNLWGNRTSLRNLPSSIATNVGTSISNALPGDIICYSGHVGIYSGNNMLINAANSTQGIVEKNYSYYGSIVAIMRVNGVVQSISTQTSGDGKGPAIYNVTITAIDNTGFTVNYTSSDPDGVIRTLLLVRGPRCLATGDGSDMKLYMDDGFNLTTAFTSFRVNFSDFGNQSGKYQIAITSVDSYIYNGFGEPNWYVDVEFNKPSITDVKVSDVTIDGYKVTCTVTDDTRIDRVQFPTWTAENGQDDINNDWWSGSDSTGSIEGNTVTYYVKRSDHNNEVKDYITHIYAFDAYGNYISTEITVSSLMGSAQDIGTEFVATIKNISAGTVVTRDSDDKVRGRSYTGLGSQHWYFKRNNNGLYNIYSVEDMNKCLNVSEATDANGTLITVSNKDGTSAQEWALYSYKSGYVFMPSSSKSRALDLESAYSTEGTNIKIWGDIAVNIEGKNCIFAVEKKNSSIKISETTKSLEVGESSIISASIDLDFFNQGYSWLSSDESVVSVDNGVIKGLKAGSAVVSAISNYDSNIKAECNVAVEAKDESAGNNNDDKGSSAGSNVAVETKDESAGNNNDDKGSSAGSNVTVETKDDNAGNINDNASSSIEKVSKIKITGLSKKIAAGKKIQLKATVSPETVTKKDVKWTISNKKYATISSTGEVVLKKAGAGKTVKVTAIATDGSGKKAIYKIKIMKHAVKSIKLKANSKSVEAGKQVKVKATIKTTGKQVNKTLKWTSSNTKYATVNSKGVVKTKKAGKGKIVTITATSTDGTNKKAKVNIKIK